MPVQRALSDFQTRQSCPVSAMSPPGRPKGEYRSAQHEGTPVRPGHTENPISVSGSATGTHEGGGPVESALKTPFH